MSKKHQHWDELGLLDMDMDEMCDELGITQEDILERFKERVRAYEKLVAARSEWDDSGRSFEDEEDDLDRDIYDYRAKAITDFSDVDDL